MKPRMMAVYETGTNKMLGMLPLPAGMKRREDRLSQVQYEMPIKWDAKPEDIAFYRFEVFWTFAGTSERHKAHTVTGTPIEELRKIPGWVDG